jgi:uncharacterized membrane protein YphA (DoxX/SURF4 family)
MSTIFLIGRLIFGGYFIINGVNHFMAHAQMAQFAAAKGVPMAEVAVLVSGALILFGGTSVVLGWRPEVGLAAIVLFLIAVSIPMHNFWTETGVQRMDDYINFTKNMGLVGASLMFVAVPRPWAYSVDAPRRSRI